MLQNVSSMPCIKSCMSYLSACRTIFPFYIENERLQSISHLTNRCGKVWFVVLIAFRTMFEQLFASYIFNPNYDHNHKRMHPSASENKITMCSLCVTKHVYTTLKIIKTGQFYRSMLSLALALTMEVKVQNRVLL